jgi:hypothetical protein
MLKTSSYERRRNVKNLPLWAAVGAAWLVTLPALAAQDRVKAWKFDDAPVGTLPRGFTQEVGEWKVVADPTAPSGKNVLAQVAKSSTPTFNITLIGDTNYQDVDITVRFKSVDGETDQGGGVVWRAKDAKNYYIARYNPLENNYRVYKVEAGKRTQLGTIKIERNEGWHTLRVTMAGDHIECYYDGKKYLDAKDTTFKEAGKIGLWTKADAQTHFDDLTVQGK